MSTDNTVEPGPGTDFDPIFKANYDAIYRYCVRRLGASDAEDAAADVFAIAWRRLDEMPRGEMGRAWLFGVAHRVVGNQHRSRRRRAGLSRRLVTVVDPLDRVDPLPVRDDELDKLTEALGSLSGTDQELLRLSSWDRLSRADIAYVLGIKENAVDQRLHRARSRLRARLDRINALTAPVAPKEASA